MQELIKAEELNNNEVVVFSNEDYSAEIYHEDDLFKVWFNGTFVLISKTFAPAAKKIEQLVNKYKLVKE